MAWKISCARASDCRWLDGDCVCVCVCTHRHASRRQVSHSRAPYRESLPFCSHNQRSLFRTNKPCTHSRDRRHRIHNRYAIDKCSHTERNNKARHKIMGAVRAIWELECGAWVRIGVLLLYLCCCGGGSSLWWGFKAALRRVRWTPTEAPAMSSTALSICCFVQIGPARFYVECAGMLTNAPRMRIIVDH